MEKKIRKELVGKVVSATNNKTITVLVETYKTHPLYHKRVKSSKKYSVHDETNNFIINALMRRRNNYVTTRKSFKSCW